MVSGVGYLFFGIARIGTGHTGLNGLVIGGHIGSTVGKFYYIDGGEHRGFYGDVDACLGILCTTLGGYEHHAIGTTGTIDSCGRGILEDRERLDGL